MPLFHILPSVVSVAAAAIKLQLNYTMTNWEGV